MNALHLSQSDAVRALRRVMAVLILLLAGSGRAAAWSGSIVSRVSVASDGTEANDTSHQPSISADGRHVAFYSDATNLVPDDTNDVSDVFVHDRQTGQTTRVSVGSDGSQANDASTQGAISADGRYVAFTSSATNLIPGEPDPHGGLFVHDRLTGETQRVSDAGGGASVSAHGRYVAFSSYADDLVPGDTNGQEDVFWGDRETGEIRRVSVATDGTQGNGKSWTDGACISGDGQRIVFISEASTLVPDDTNNANDVFVHDVSSGETVRVSVASDGTQGDWGSGYLWGGGRVGISQDGRWAVFHSWAGNLVPENPSSVGVYVHDLLTGETLPVPGPPPEMLDAIMPNPAPTDKGTAISGDGRYVAYHTCYYTPPPLPYRPWDVYVSDMETGEVIRASRASGAALADGGSLMPALSAGGQVVAFRSSATNLVSGDTNGVGDIFAYARYEEVPFYAGLPVIGRWGGAE